MTAPKPPFRLVLTQGQAAALRESGIGFVAGSPCALSTSQATLLLFECDEKSANAACRVAQGTHRAVTITKPAPSTSTQTTP